jgi:hypothetical protein
MADFAGARKWKPVMSLAGNKQVVDTSASVARWRVLGLLSVAVVLSMTPWFSATAVVPELTAEWGLSAGAASWLTNAVQIGFVIGALAASFVNLPDMVPLRWLMAGSAILAAASNLVLN